MKKTEIKNAVIGIVVLLIVVAIYYFAISSSSIKLKNVSSTAASTTVGASNTLSSQTGSNSQAGLNETAGVYLGQTQLDAIFNASVVNYTTYDLQAFQANGLNSYGFTQPTVELIQSTQPEYNGLIADGWVTMASVYSGPNQTTIAYVVVKVGTRPVGMYKNLSGIDFGFNMTNTTNGIVNSAKYSYGNAQTSGANSGILFTGSKGSYEGAVIITNVSGRMLAINKTTVIRDFTAELPSR